jgi:nucleoredoxin
LLKGSEKVSLLESLNGKEIVALYFSAHWCPPCKQFTPKLADVYNDLIKSQKSFEIVFVSSDRSEEEFYEYFKEMPWIALPYS